MPWKHKIVRCTHPGKPNADLVTRGPNKVETGSTWACTGCGTLFQLKYSQRDGYYWNVEGKIPVPERLAATPQPAPVGDGLSITDQVIADFEARREFGINKYGVELKSHNGRDPLWDLYQELMDGLLYLRQHLIERDTTEVETELEL